MVRAQWGLDRIPGEHEMRCDWTENNFSPPIISQEDVHAAKKKDAADDRLTFWLGFRIGHPLSKLHSSNIKPSLIAPIFLKA